MDGTRFSNRLAAILAADAAGYSRLMAADEHATVAALDAARAVFRHRDRSPARPRHRHGGGLDPGGVRYRHRGGVGGTGYPARTAAIDRCRARRSAHALSHRRAPGRRDREGRRHGLWRRREHRRAAAGAGRTRRHHDLGRGAWRSARQGRCALRRPGRTGGEEHRGAGARLCGAR